MIHSVRFTVVSDTNVVFPVIIDLNQEKAVAAFREMVLHKKNPKQDCFEVLSQLRNAGLNDTANYLHALL